MLFCCAVKEYFVSSAKEEKAVKPVTVPVEAGLKASEDFVQGSEDVPLLLGMTRVSDGSMGFDSAVGSIVSSSYQSTVEPQKVRDFYIKTLPQMGWTLAQSNAEKSTFKRDGEKLEIEFLVKDGAVLVNFFLSSSL